MDVEPNIYNDKVSLKGIVQELEFVGSANDAQAPKPAPKPAAQDDGLDDVPF